MKKLSNEGYGVYIDKDEMAKDLVLPARNCFCAFIKINIRALDDTFFDCVCDKECNADLYTTNYDKPIDDASKKVAMKYTPHKNYLMISPCQTETESE